MKGGEWLVSLTSDFESQFSQFIIVIYLILIYCAVVVSVPAEEKGGKAVTLTLLYQCFI